MSIFAEKRHGTTVTKSTSNAGKMQDTKNGKETVISNDGEHKNIANVGAEHQLYSPGDDNIPITGHTFLERVLSWRSFTVGLLHLSYVLSIMPVIAISFSLVCMCGPVKGPGYDTRNTSRLYAVSMYAELTPLGNITMPQEKVYEFNWDPQTRGLLISGYMFTGFLAPQLSNLVRGYLGNKLTLTLFSSFFAFISFVSPIAARTNVYFFLAIRILSGFCKNVQAPIAADTLAWWTPAKEKLTSSTIVISGWIVGSSLASLIAGYFCKINIDNGWTLQFYFHGILVVLWTIAWHCLSFRKPENHPYISEKEKAYILAYRVGMNQANTKGADKTPYRTILTSRPVLAFVIRTVLHLWSLMIIFTCIPLYLTSVLKFSLAEAASVFSVMSILRLPGALLWSAFGNWLIGLKNMTTNKVRKICDGSGQGFVFVLFIGVSFLDETHKWAAVVLLSLCVISGTFGTTMLSVIPLDMAPRYAGVTAAVAITAADIVSWTAPLTATAITNLGTFEQWRVVWIIMAIVNLSAGLVFLIFGNASLQSWAVPKSAPTSIKVKDQSSSDMIVKNDSPATSFLTVELRK